MPLTLPSPPINDTPPSTQAVMASNATPEPVFEFAEPPRAVKRSAAMANKNPPIANTNTLILATLIPARRAASGLPPAA